MQRTVYKINKAGNIAHLKQQRESLKAPEAHEVQIEVMAIGLNFADIFAILGLYSATPQGSFIPGLEYAGQVLACGKDVKHLKKGDAIMGVSRFGAYATHLNIDAQYVKAMPNSWSYAEGAAFPVQALTAYYGLFYLGNLKEKETVLIHSAAGGVGLLANRMAKKAGAYTIGTVGSSHKIDLLQSEGYDDWIIRDKNFKQNLDKATKDRGLDLVMECIGGKVFTQAYELLNPQGRMTVYGSARYTSPGNKPNWFKLIPMYLTRPKIDPQKMIESNKAIMGFNLIWLYHQAELMDQLMQEINALELDTPFIGHRFSFDELPKAIKLFQSGTTMGKVVIEL